MESFGTRAVITYGFTSLAFLFAHVSMKENGYNSPYNPAWHLISNIYTLYKWSWWLLATVFALFVVISVMIRIAEHLAEQKRLREAEIRQREESVRHHQESFRNEILNKELEREEEKRKQKLEEDMKRKEEKYLESLKRRTPQEAVELALQSFCKGGS